MDHRYYLIITLAVILALAVLLSMVIRIMKKKNDRLKEELQISQMRGKELSEYRKQLESLRQQMKEQIERGLPDMQLSEELEESLSEIMTGRPVIDTLLRSKLARCSQMGISVSYRLGRLPEDGLSDEDMISLLNNLINNAIEAVERRRVQETSGVKTEKQTESAARKDISMESRFIMGQWAFVIENLKPAGDSPLERGMKTSKGDEINHGWGTRIIDRIADDAGGAVRRTDKGDTFRVLVTIPVDK